ncbi:hypothetical protein NGR_b22460 (plasmid) [Sinorhizobium fredii NGR234]|uniref:BON domain-containing protein n=1 Tax=Sinorhizobium fredii (strain NBRC 101917 / NGR234) TaxID=394 RepID=C3KN61_SINFN|nr:BON domain-containing protein [Sinorhizobium fredii]ACP23691.1 hypothetical protein NGR_b22460 [Sinorhizobium fredii NGR234]
MKRGWQDPDTRHATGAKPSDRRPLREGGSDEEHWRRRGDEGGECAWRAEALRRSDRRGNYHGLTDRDLARRIEDLGSFDPYENVPPFRGRSGQEDWPGGGQGADEVGRFRGKGPRGYKRPDARIEEDVNERLTEDPRLDASDIEVSVSGGEVTLAGFVSSRRDRRRAEDCSEGVSGVSYVQNNLRVRTAGI